jgi:hypothetical protein
MAARNWTDLDIQGRRVNKTVNLCETMVHNLMYKDKELRPIIEMDHDLIIAYMKTGLQASHQLQPATDMKLNLKMLQKLAEKKYLEQITDIKLKELA